ncbi:hypothetical protein Droror1_Dr00000580 [Drosera rotundifolia]
MSSIQFSINEDNNNEIPLYTLHYCRCKKLAPIKIVRSNRPSKGRSYFNCEVCGYFVRCPPVAGGASVDGRDMTRDEGEPFSFGNSCQCGCLSLASKVKALELVVRAIVILVVLTLIIKRFM